MSDFKAKMHQNRFRLGLRSRPRWGAYSALPDPLGAVLLREGDIGREGKWRGGGTGERKKGREGREERKGGEGTNFLIFLRITYLMTSYSSFSW